MPGSGGIRLGLGVVMAFGSSGIGSEAEVPQALRTKARTKAPIRAEALRIRTD